MAGTTAATTALTTAATTEPTTVATTAATTAITTIATSAATTAATKAATIATTTAITTAATTGVTTVATTAVTTSKTTVSTTAATTSETTVATTATSLSGTTTLSGGGFINVEDLSDWQIILISLGALALLATLLGLCFMLASSGLSSLLGGFSAGSYSPAAAMAKAMLYAPRYYTHFQQSGPQLQQGEHHQWQREPPLHHTLEHHHEHGAQGDSHNHHGQDSRDGNLEYSSRNLRYYP
ncbi:uncharacterized protein LOC144754139 isoform X1 [Lissotriton helveticus]